MLTPGESQFPGGEYTGESITNTNNSLKIRENSKSFLGRSNGTWRSCLMKKTRVKKSRDTVLLSIYQAMRIICKAKYNSHTEPLFKTN
jgi:hypothetical protein